MNTYIITYRHKGKTEEAYLYAESFEDAREKLESIGYTGAINWELVKRIPVTDPDVAFFVNSAQETKAVIRQMKGGS